MIRFIAGGPRSLISKTSRCLFEPLESRTLLSAAGNYQHVLIISIDGLHQEDLADPALRADLSNILGLASNGVSYPNAHLPGPSDSFVGVMGYFTGAGPNTTGVYYDNTYDRSLTAPGGSASDPKGTEVLYDEFIDKNSNLITGGGDYGRGSIDPAKLPIDFSSGSARLIYPHDYSNVNTIFEVAHEAGLYTAYSDKHPSYDLVSGPSGAGLDDFYGPEIAAKAAIVNGKLVDASTAPAGTKLTKISKVTSLTEAYDNLKIQAIINQIDGKTSLGTKSAPVPNLFGFNLQAVNVAQKDPAGGIDLDAAGNEVVSSEMHEALAHTDAGIARIIAELKAKNLFNSTLVILTAKHGQTPRIGSAKNLAPDVFTGVLESAGIEVAQATQDASSIMWLKDPSQTAAAVAALNALKGTAADPRIDTILSGDSLAAAGLASSANRTPDLVVVLKPGILISDSFKRAEHGGFSEEDTHVPIIISGGGLNRGSRGRIIAEGVQTTQIAVTALRALGLDPHQLQGAVVEHTTGLPGLGLHSHDQDQDGDFAASSSTFPVQASESASIFFTHSVKRSDLFSDVDE